MLELKDIRLSYGNAQILNGVDLSVNRGDVVSIIGPSGTGKTTLLKCINSLVTPSSGTIAFDQIRMDYQRPDKTAIQAIRRRTAMVFQQFNVFKNMTVIENVMDPLVVVQRKSKDEAREIALQELERVGLSDEAGQLPVPALRWPAPADGHRARAGGSTGRHALRRTDVLAGPRTRR